ncbi:MAG: SAM-dependent DNA methyltransferase [Bacilli bacterium]|nr:SAM-dependent DNA methyltransferase [Bacilli bacterium]
MTTEREIIRKTEKMIDELKSVCSTYGLGNASSEYKIITEIFLYKYLNDKFIYETKKVAKELNENSTTKEVEKYLDSLGPEQFSILTMRMGANVAKIQNSYRVSTLFNNQNSTMPEFYELFDNALIGISNDNVDIFSVKTGSKEKIKLFDTLSQYITESDKRNAFFRAMISKLVEFSFENAFSEKYDFFATIFEYLIKDYNKDFGKYAEYYTPNSIARIIAKILAPDPTQNVTLYDPAAGSGTLLLALAHQIGEENCTIYSQDISQKSNEFLRLNLILNNLVHSLGNVIHGDTLLNPAHLNKEKNGLAKFDYIVSNPPFKTDFSDTRNDLDNEKFKERFFAGVPNIPNKDKDKMAIYLLFIQHILYSLKEEGKSAIVVPTGFLTGQSGIERKIREKLIDSKMLKGVISMPSNIFANTGTNVSVIFLDKTNVNGKVLLVDGANLGIKIKDGKNQKTVLRENEIEKIVEVFNQLKEEKDFSVLVNFDDIKEKKYSFSAGQYFPVKIEKVEMSDEEFNNMISSFKNKVEEYYKIQNELHKELVSNLEKIKYE